MLCTSICVCVCEKFGVCDTFYILHDTCRPQEESTQHDVPIHEHIMLLPVEELQHIISFSTHVGAAINYLQSQCILSHQWIIYQLQLLRLLDKNHPNLHVSSTIFQLD